MRTELSLSTLGWGLFILLTFIFVVVVIFTSIRKLNDVRCLLWNSFARLDRIFLFHVVNAGLTVQILSRPSKFLSCGWSSCLDNQEYVRC